MSTLDNGRLRDDSRSRAILEAPGGVLERPSKQATPRRSADQPPEFAQRAVVRASSRRDFLDHAIGRWTGFLMRQHDTCASALGRDHLNPRSLEPDTAEDGTTQMMVDRPSEATPAWLLSDLGGKAVEQQGNEDPHAVRELSLSLTDHGKDRIRHRRMTFYPARPEYGEPFERRWMRREPRADYVRVPAPSGTAKMV